MSYLDKFSAEEREMLVALPYRAGLWVGMSDEAGGEAALAAERNALHIIVTSFAEDCLKSAFAEEVLKATLAAKESWPSWEKGLEGVPDECARAIGLILSKIDEKHAYDFRHDLMEIATSVALAFHEGADTANQSVGIERYLIDIKQFFLQKLGRESGGPVIEDDHISQSEHKALAALSAALQTPHATPSDSAVG